MNAIRNDLHQSHQSMISAVGGLMITNGTFNQTIVQGSLAGLKLLKDAASPAAFHNSGHQFDLPKCHPNTRVAVQQRVKDWIYGRIDTEAFILWLYGGAGAGKSAIGRSIAEWCESENLLLASFFFSRSDSTRNHIKSFVTTVACGIIRSYPAARPLIEVAVDIDPFLLSSSIEHQFTKLIIEPLLQLDEALISQSRPYVIIIDGLDECLERTEQKMLLRLISSCFKKFNLRLKVLVASRPEQAIVGTFDAIPLKHLSTRLALSDHQDSDDDIRRFLEDKFSDIKLTHPRKAFLPADWPTRWEIQQLVAKSSGHFIYASTVISFIESDLHKPSARLNSILKIGPTASSQDRDLPFVQLDSLYTYILSASQVSDNSVVSRVVGSCILIPRFWSEWASVETPCALDMLVGVLNLDIEDVHAILGELGSMVQVSESGVRVLHASLEDFLFDNHRSRQLWADRASILTDVARYFLSSKSLVNDPQTWKSLVRLLSGATATPQLLECLVQVDLLPILEATEGDRIIPIFFAISVVLRALVLGVDQGEDVYQKYFSAISKWLSHKLEAYLPGSHKLRALISLYFSTFKDSTYYIIRLSRTDSRIDSNNLCANWVVYATDDPQLNGLGAEVWAENRRFRARLFDRRTHASAALLCGQFLLRYPSLLRISNLVPILETNNGRSRALRPWQWRIRTRRRRHAFQRRQVPQDVAKIEAVEDGSDSDYDDIDTDKIEDWQIKRVLQLLPEFLELADRSSELVHTISALALFGTFAFSAFDEWLNAREAMKKYLSDIRPPNRSSVRAGRHHSMSSNKPKFSGVSGYHTAQSRISLFSAKNIWSSRPEIRSETSDRTDLSDVD